MIKTYKPTSPARRQRTLSVSEGRKRKPMRFAVKNLMSSKRGSVGRSAGKISRQCRDSGEKKRYRNIDYKRDKYGIEGKIEFIEYDPNRTCDIALVLYNDGERRYMLAPAGIKEGDSVVSGEGISVKTGNALPLSDVPVGIPVHNVELYPGAGGKFIRTAGSAAFVTAHEKGYVTVKMPSGEIRNFLSGCFATIGQLGREDWKLMNIGKAGRSMHMGRRPKTRGKARSGQHPHGGSYSRRVGRNPVDQWGNLAKGKKTRRRKHTDKYIVKDRRAR
ncbi:50S ribosomal protein L2 [candidate division WWE3 bacterium RIFCSPLOWO2_01_FULL_39_13]|uniref:50S ribosomal protein L2 n=1 Tax=candidate division WWE3 bacterium RIFCSPLOWO2_01_FULL_39_13 TaxID=1802624 RepID=A0A1F4V4S7_UNCKA|nr:MAG: 50S ribosomal protein L2 [candidate division WWE3 bacterium RIFCSPLOWO2_01_FULL_39_13]